MPRFDRTERIVHWANATLFLVLIATGAALYAGPVSTLVGRRVLMKNIHVYAGLLLPIPVLVGSVAPLGRRVPGRFPAPQPVGGRATAAGGGASKRPNVELGKFNPGQKLNAVFILAAIPVMLGTGIDHAVVRAVPARLAHGRDVRARLVRDRALLRGAGSHRARVRGSGCAARHDCAGGSAPRGLGRNDRAGMPRSEESGAARDLAARRRT